MVSFFQNVIPLNYLCDAYICMYECIFLCVNEGIKYINCNNKKNFNLIWTEKMKDINLTILFNVWNCRSFRINSEWIKNVYFSTLSLGLFAIFYWINGPLLSVWLQWCLKKKNIVNCQNSFRSFLGIDF